MNKVYPPVSDRQRRRHAQWMPPGALDGGVPIGRIIGSVLSSVKRQEQAPGNALIKDWDAVVGKAVAAHTRPGRLVNGDLTVFVDSSVWLSELQRYAQREMLANLQKACGAGTVRKVRLQLDPGR
jgi:predicted nucleic acid-binding Zn ribbon protein